MRALVLALAGLSLTAGAASAQDAVVRRGAAVFQKWCAPCHADGPGNDGRKSLPGTGSLALKYKGEKPALLEQRTDLPAAVLKTFVRGGIASMTPFRKTEVSDADIEAIAAYLQSTSAKGR